MNDNIKILTLAAFLLSSSMGQAEQTVREIFENKAMGLYRNVQSSTEAGKTCLNSLKAGETINTLDCITYKNGLFVVDELKKYLDYAPTDVNQILAASEARLKEINDFKNEKIADVALTIEAQHLKALIIRLWEIW